MYQKLLKSGSGGVPLGCEYYCRQPVVVTILLFGAKILSTASKVKGDVSFHHQQMCDVFIFTHFIIQSHLCEENFASHFSVSCFFLILKHVTRYRGRGGKGGSKSASGTNSAKRRERREEAGVCMDGMVELNYRVELEREAGERGEDYTLAGK